MYDIRQSVQLLKEISQTCLDREIKQTKQTHPNMNDAEVLQHVTKYNLPSSIEGSPRWHKFQLQDLLAMVEKFGMLDFFLTLTVDEASSLRWKEITHMEHMVQKIDASLTWKDCPVECAILFYARLKKFMHSYILSGPRILGYVKEYVLRYEIQFRGSLHAHIILWIENSDVEHIANEITATVPAVFDTTLKKFLEPTDPHQNRLFKEVMQKQLHSCCSRCHHKKM